MRRRTFLGAALAAVAGLLGLGGGPALAEIRRLDYGPAQPGGWRSYRQRRVRLRDLRPGDHFTHGDRPGDILEADSVPRWDEGAGTWTIEARLLGREMEGRR